MVRELCLRLFLQVVVDERGRRRKIVSFVEGANLRRGVGLSTFGYIGEMGSSSGRRPQQPPPHPPAPRGRRDASKKKSYH